MASKIEGALYREVTGPTGAPRMFPVFPLDNGGFRATTVESISIAEATVFGGNGETGAGNWLVSTPGSSPRHDTSNGPPHWRGRSKRPCAAE